MNINLNDFVKVKLTDLGKDIYYHQLDEVNELIRKCGGTQIQPKMPVVDKDGKTKIQLWEFIELYGKHIGMGKPNVIEPLDLEVIDKGRWVTNSTTLDSNNTDYFCSRCGHKLKMDYTTIKAYQEAGKLLFCEHCGADMREE